MQWQNQQQLQLQLQQPADSEAAIREAKRLRRNPVCFSIENAADEKLQATRQAKASPRIKKDTSNTKNEECRI